MGCWLDTCALSQLPIPYKTPTLCFVFLQGTSWRESLASGFSYPDEAYTPTGLPWVGEYNDYGTIENARALAPDYEPVVLAFLKNNGVEGTLQEVLDKLERSDGITYRDYKGKQQPLGRALVRLDVYEAILSFKYPDPYDFQGQRELSRESVRAAAVEWAREAMKLREVSDRVESLTRAFRFDDEMLDKNNQFANLVRGERAHALRRVQNDLKVDLGSPDSQKTLDQVQNTLNTLADLAFVQYWMNVTRRSWHPQSGAGSQTSAWEWHEDFLRTVADIARREREREERGD